MPVVHLSAAMGDKILRAFAPISVFLVAVLTFSCGGPEGTGTTPAPQPDKPLRLKLEQVMPGLANPVELQEVPDGSGRLFVVEQQVTIRIIQATVNPRLGLTRRLTGS